MTICPCGTNANFGYPGSTAQCCSKCRKPEMENLYGKRCEHPTCRLFAGFNFPDKTKSRFCKTHSLPGMTNVICGKCLDCDQYASYCYPENKKRLYCSKHAKPGMVNRAYVTSKRKDVNKAGKKVVSKTFFYTGAQLNPDGTIKNWGKKVCVENEN